MHLHTVIRVVPGQIETLLRLLREDIKPIMENGGWKLLGSFSGKTGPTNVIVNLWDIGTIESFTQVRAALAAHPQFPRIRATLDRCVAEETLTLVEQIL